MLNTKNILNNFPNKLFVNASEQIVDEYIRRAICLENRAENCGCEACSNFRARKNPDVLFIDVNNKEEVAAAEFRKTLNTFFFTAKNMSSGKVIVIKDIDRLGITAQNVLLQNVEDNNNLAIIVATCSDETAVLPTVRSRMTIEKYRSQMSFNEFEQWCFSQCIGESTLYYALTAGDVSKVKGVGVCMNIWKDVIRLLPDKTKITDLLKLLHLVKEKDKEVFCDRYPNMIIPLYTLMQQVFLSCIEMLHGDKPSIIISQPNWTEMEIFDNIMLLDEEISKCRERSYKSKDMASFFMQLYKTI